MAGIHSDDKGDRAVVGGEASLHHVVLGILEDRDAAAAADLDQCDGEQLLRSHQVDQHGLSILGPVGYNRTAIGTHDLRSAAGGKREEVLVAANARLGVRDSSSVRGDFERLGGDLVSGGGEIGAPEVCPVNGGSGEVDVVPVPVAGNSALIVGDNFVLEEDRTGAGFD